MRDDAGMPQQDAAVAPEPERIATPTDPAADAVQESPAGGDTTPVAADPSDVPGDARDVPAPTGSGDDEARELRAPDDRRADRQDRGWRTGDRRDGGWRQDTRRYDASDTGRGRYRRDQDRGRFADAGGSRYPRRDEDVRSDGSPNDPPLSDEIDPRELAPEVRAELRSLTRGTAEAVARRLVATGQLIDLDPSLAFAHALVARRLASRIPAVREATGLAAYHAGQWQTAISELRTYHRMTGRQAHVAVLADCERALGRPERAVDLYRATDGTRLDETERIELLVVAAGARVDMKQPEAAAAMLQIRELVPSTTTPWLARLRYAYADALLAAGRTDEAREWFARAAEVDDEVSTDAAERLLDLDGVVLDTDDAEDLDDLDAVDGDADRPESDADAEDGAAEDEEDEEEEDLDAEEDDEEDLEDEDEDEDEDGGDEDLDDEDAEDHTGDAVGTPPVSGPGGGPGRAE